MFFANHFSLLCVFLDKATMDIGSNILEEHLMKLWRLDIVNWEVKY